MLSAYMLHLPVTVVERRGTKHRLMQLPEGSIFYAEHGALDRTIMIEGTCNGNVVLMFSRDLDECTRQISAARAAVATIAS